MGREKYREGIIKYYGYDKKGRHNFIEITAKLEQALADKQKAQHQLHNHAPIILVWIFICLKQLRLTCIANDQIVKMIISFSLISFPTFFSVYIVSAHSELISRVHPFPWTLPSPLFLSLYQHQIIDVDINFINNYIRMEDLLMMEMKLEAFLKGNRFV